MHKYRVIRELWLLLYEMIYWVFLIKIVPINTGPILNGYGAMVVF